VANTANISADPWRDPAIVRFQGVSQWRMERAAMRQAAARAAPVLLPDRLASAFGHVRRPGGMGNELLLRGEAAQIRAVFEE